MTDESYGPRSDVLVREPKPEKNSWVYFPEIVTSFIFSAVVKGFEREP